MCVIITKMEIRGCLELSMCFFARSGLLEEACLDNNCRRVLATSETSRWVSCLNIFFTLSLSSFSNIFVLILLLNCADKKCCFIL